MTRHRTPSDERDVGVSIKLSLEGLINEEPTEHDANVVRPIGKNNVPFISGRGKLYVRTFNRSDYGHRPVSEISLRMVVAVQQFHTVMTAITGNVPEQRLDGVRWPLKNLSVSGVAEQ